MGYVVGLLHGNTVPFKFLPLREYLLPKRGE